MRRLPSDSTGRSTRTFRRMRRTTLAESDICIICGHPGADSADHIIPRSLAPELAEHPGNLGAAHYEPCPTCAMRCQRVKGVRSLEEVRSLKTSRDWFVTPVK